MKKNESFGRFLFRAMVSLGFTIFTMILVKEVKKALDDKGACGCDCDHCEKCEKEVKGDSPEASKKSKKEEGRSMAMNNEKLKIKNKSLNVKNTKSPRAKSTLSLSKGRGVDDKSNSDLEIRRNNIMRLFSNQEEVTIDDVKDILPGVHVRTIRRDLGKLVEDKKIKKIGKTKGSKYMLA